MSTVTLCTDQREVCHTQAGICLSRENISGIYTPVSKSHYHNGLSYDDARGSRARG